MLTFQNSDLAKVIKESLNVDVGARDFFPFSDVDQSVRDDVALLAKEPLILPGTPIIGLTYDVKTGALKEVAQATNAKVEGGAPAAAGKKAEAGCACTIS